MNKCGPALVEGHLEDIANGAVEILEKKSLCQQDPDGDDEAAGADADSSEYESALISNATDIFGAMAAVLGPDFGQAFGQVLPLISMYAQPKRISSERSMAIGSLGEIMMGLKTGVTPFTGALLEVISRGLQDEEPDVRSNSAFAAGVLIQETDEDLSHHFPALFGVLTPFFQVADKSPPAVYNARDNAAGALGRMIVKNAGALPLDQVAQILVSVMPLHFDPLENTAVYKGIFALFRSHPQVLEPHLDQLLAAFAYNLNPENADETSEATRAELAALVQHLKDTVPDKVAAAGL